VNPSVAASGLAKLSRPDADSLNPRPRLHARLDAARSGFAWVGGPAGAGKTSLLNTWPRAHELPVLWYRVDAGDADPGTLFQDLACAAGPAAPALPGFAPEFLVSLPLFARRFFRAFLAALPPRTVLVFDNCHEAPAESPFLLLLDLLLQEKPPGLTVLAASRESLPPALQRWQLEPRFASLGWDDLRCTPAEAQNIAQLLKAPDASLAQLDLAGGWMAGLVLMLKVELAEPRAERGAAGQAREAAAALFTVFANQAFDSLSDATRQVLLATAFAPRVSAELAQELSANSESATVLADLYRSHFFVERHLSDDASPSYEYHPLLRAFLRERAERTLSTDALQRQWRVLAERTEALDHLNDAVALWCRLADWRALAALIARHAPTLLARGQLATLARWVASVPSEAAQGLPGLLYWGGIGQMAADPAAARERLVAAYRGYANEADTVGALLAACAVLQSHFLEWNDWTGARPWVDVVARLVEALGEYPSLEVEARVIATGAEGLIFPCPEHPLAARWADRAEQLIATLPDPPLRVALASFAIGYRLWRGEPRRARHIADLVRPLEALPELSPLTLIVLHMWYAICLLNDGEHEAAAQRCQRALECGAAHDVHFMDFHLHAVMAVIAGVAGDPRRTLSAMQSAGATVTAGMGARLWYAMGRIKCQLLLGDVQGAIDVGEQAKAELANCGWAFGQAYLHVVRAMALLQAQRTAEARPLLAKAATFGERMPSHLFAFLSGLMLAECERRQGNEGRLLDHLRAALAIGRRQDLRGFLLPTIHLLLAPLMAEALRAGIEVDYVRSMIGWHRLAAPPGQDEAWPFPLRILALGQFALQRDGEALQSQGKAQAKPLELLRALIAHGATEAGKGAEVRNLIDQLWPDLEAGDPKASFDMCLMRLRKLLQVDGALCLSAGRLWLDPQVVWCDVSAFERNCDVLHRQLLVPGHETLLRETADRICRHYRGRLFGAVRLELWSMAAHERLALQFARAVTVYGQHLEAGSAWLAAIQLYERGLAQDQTAEPFYRGLMRCHLALGQNAAAHSVYQRCHDVLSVAMRVSPSADMRALFARIVLHR